nr:MAG TPA: hypothetical protein [Caudoviricetes sp.]
MKTSFACDYETMARLAEYERDYQEHYFLPVDSARKGAIRREHEERRTAKRVNDLFHDMIDLSIKINNESLRGYIDRDLANTAVAALTALSKSINK